VALPLDTPEVLERFHGGLALVEVLAKRVSRSVGVLVDYDDLLSAGREGLLEAARRFDPERGIPFGAFANFRVRGAMLDGVRKMAALPRRAYERVAALEAAASTSEGASDLSPSGTAQDDAESEGSLTEHLEILATAAATALCAGPTQAFEESRSATTNPEIALERAELLAYVHEGLKMLAVDEAALIRRYYLEGERLEDIAKDLNIKKSWASRMQARAIARLTRHLRRVI
jgi:RNA polymerase sigma factor for flagellar operon FliA